jgi:hypothetical protein
MIWSQLANWSVGCTMGVSSGARHAQPDRKISKRIEEKRMIPAPRGGRQPTQLGMLSTRDLQ